MLGCRNLFWVVLALALVSSACGPSGEDVASAIRAYQEAVDAEAHRYSPESLALASRALDQALDHLELQKQRALPFRDVSQTRALLGRALQLARGAKYEAVARRDEIRQEAAMLIREVTLELGEIEKSLLSVRPQDPSRGSWIGHLRAASGALGEARRAFQGGDYLDAHAEASRVAEQLRVIERVEPSS